MLLQSDIGAFITALKALAVPGRTLLVLALEVRQLDRIRLFLQQVCVHVYVSVVGVVFTLWTHSLHRLRQQGSPSWWRTLSLHHHQHSTPSLPFLSPCTVARTWVTHSCTLRRLLLLTSSMCTLKPSKALACRSYNRQPFTQLATGLLASVPVGQPSTWLAWPCRGTSVTYSLAYNSECLRTSSPAPSQLAGTADCA